MRANLRDLNSFGIDIDAAEYIEIGSEQELLDLIEGGFLRDKDILVIGGGSNLLFRNDFNGTIIKAVFNGIRIIEENASEVLLECDAGVVWDKLVEYCVENNFGGIENLSYIPGNVGAAPIQNIGAYGCEIASVIKDVSAIMLENGEKRIFSNKDCEFDYRNSLFKKKYKGKVLICSVRFALQKNPLSFNTSYGIVSERVTKLGGPSLKNIREAIISIRKEKLPEPDEIGNAGSFFKNPLIKEEHYSRIAEHYEKVPSHSSHEGWRKIPAGWLIEQCGWKGYRKGDAGVHKMQALVLVNYGTASGEEIYELSEEIIESVASRFNIVLEREVNVI